MMKAPHLQRKTARRLTLPILAAIAPLTLAAALGLAACENVASYSQPSLVRVIDASYIAPAINVQVEGTLLATNIGQGTISSYGTLPASGSAVIDVTATTGGAGLATTSAALLAGHQHSVFLTDNSAASGYVVTLLEDQQDAAPSGHSTFRFLNQATKTGAVDIYMVPAGSTLATSLPLVKALAAGSATLYVSFASQTVNLVVTPSGVTRAKYTSPSLALTGGEVRTALILDTQLTANPPVNVFLADDVN